MLFENIFVQIYSYIHTIRNRVPKNAKCKMLSGTCFNVRAYSIHAAFEIFSV